MRVSDEIPNNYEWRRQRSGVSEVRAPQAAAGPEVLRRRPAGGAWRQPSGMDLLRRAGVLWLLGGRGAELFAAASWAPAGTAAHTGLAADAMLRGDAELAGRSLLTTPKRRGQVRQSAKTYELVLSRHEERIHWVQDIPDIWGVTVYNTGLNDLPNITGRPFRVVRLKNTKFGKEGMVYAKHIARRYGDALADYTVFSQANPFDHNDHFLDLLWHPALLSPVQTMSTKFSEVIPPKNVRDLHSPDLWYRSDKFSLRTMESIYFSDCCVHTVGSLYASHYNLSSGANLGAHLLAKIGLPDWIPEEQEVASFAYAGMFGASKAAILQHPKHVYTSLVPAFREHVMVGYVMERLWLVLFGGPDYEDKQPGAYRRHLSLAADVSDAEIMHEETT